MIQTKTLVNRIDLREIKALILFMAAYLTFYHSPLFGEYLDAMKENPVITSAQEPAPQENALLSVESDYFKIYYDPTVNLDTIYRKLNKRVFYISGPSIEDTLSTSQEKVAYRLDVLFRRVEEVLDMYPNKVKLNVKIFKDHETLNDEYYKIFRQRADYKAFYIHRYETIYTSEEDITDTIIVHEMGHSVVDNYFNVIPPAKVRELLANYVELHLEE